MTNIHTSHHLLISNCINYCIGSQMICELRTGKHSNSETIGLILKP